MVHADLHPERPERIRLAAAFRHTPLVKMLPGHQRGKDDWSIPLSWTSVLALKNTVHHSELTVADDLRAWVRAEHARRVLPAMALRQVVDIDSADADARLAKIGDERSRRLLDAIRALPQPVRADGTVRPRYPHQSAGAAFLGVAGRALLGDEQGAGKTTTVISALRLLHEAGENVLPALVVGPNTTKIGWQREFDTVWPGRTINVVKGGPDAKRALLEPGADVYVLNWEALRIYSRLAAYGGTALTRCPEHKGHDPKITAAKCDVHPGPLNDIEFASVIADEAHRSKDPSAKATRALKYASGGAAVRFALTGTPIADTPDDLWSVLNWMAPNEWPSRSSFVDQFCDLSWDEHGHTRVSGLKRSRSAEFFSSFDPRFRRMPKALVLPFLPPVVHERRDVEMNPKQAKAYEQMRALMVAEIEGGMVLTKNGMTKMTRLLQFASSYAELVVPERAAEPDEEFEDDVEEDLVARVRLAAPSCKIDALLADLDDFEGQAVVVFAVSRQLIELLSARLTSRSIDHGLITGAQNEDQRQQAIDDLDAGRVQFVLCTSAGGTGITLTRASTAVFLQRSWSSIDNGQAESRVHRIGSEQHEQVTIIDYVSEGTVEETVIEAVRGKGERLEEILRDRDLLLSALAAPVLQRATSTRKRVPAPDEPGTVPPITV